MILIMILNILNMCYREVSYAQVGPFHREMASALDLWQEDMVQD